MMKKRVYYTQVPSNVFNIVLSGNNDRGAVYDNIFLLHRGYQSKPGNVKQKKKKNVCTF